MIFKGLELIFRRLFLIVLEPPQAYPISSFSPSEAFVSSSPDLFKVSYSMAGVSPVFRISMTQAVHFSCLVL